MDDDSTIEKLDAKPLIGLLTYIIYMYIIISLIS